MSQDPIEVDSTGEQDETPWVIGVLSGGGPLDGREVRLREGDLPRGIYTQPPADWSAYLIGGALADLRGIALPPPIYWRWTGRTDQHGRAVFERERPG